MSKEIWIKLLTDAIVIGLAACIPLGIFLAFWFNNSTWLILCAPLIIFL